MFSCFEGKKDFRQLTGKKMAPHALLLLLVSGMAGWAQGTDRLRIEDPQRTKLGIETLHPEAVTSVPVGLVPARVVVPPENERVISAPLEALVERVMVSEGDTVQAGQLLVRLDSPQLLLHQQHLLDAWNEYQVAEARHTREQRLFQAGIIARKRWLETEKAWRQARIALSQAKRELQVMGLNSRTIEHLLASGRLDSHLSLRAPFDGMVTRLDASVGARLMRGEHLLTVMAPDPLWLRLAVPVKVADQLVAGSQVEVESQHARAVVKTVAGTVDPDTQTVLVRADLTEPNGLQPGRKVTARLVVPGGQLLKLPRQALVEYQGGSYLFVETPEGFEVRPVSVLRTTSDAVYLDKGLRPGEAVAVKGVAALKATWLGMGEGE